MNSLTSLFRCISCLRISKVRGLWLMLLVASGAVLFSGLQVANARRAAFSVQEKSQDSNEVWQSIDRTILNGRIAAAVPEQARTLKLNAGALLALLNRAPREGKSGGSEVIVPLPMPDGSFARFSLKESSILSPELAAQYPEIKSYLGQGVDDATLTMRCDWSPRGFHATLLGKENIVTIHPARYDDATSYVSYQGQDIQVNEACNTAELDLQVKERLTKLTPNAPRVTFGANLRTFRMAIATTQEYTNDPQLGGGTQAGAIASLNTWLNGTNVIYERDLAVRFTLVTNNAVIFTAEPDGFTNGNDSTMLTEVGPILKNGVGEANYDVGHVMAKGSSGRAGGPPCTAAKEGGASGVQGPVGNTGFMLLFAHEVGHQFGAPHTFNATTSTNCAGNRSADAAVETGAGHTIMSYSGTCAPNNLAGSGKGTHFHATTIATIQAFLAGAGCAVTTATGNNAPTVSGGPDYTIPRQTPFTLTASGTDPDLGDLANLTYSWEQVDVGGANFGNPAYNDAGDPPTTTRPIFRPFDPSTNPSRTFPSLTYILNNANTPPETVTAQFGQVLQTAEQLPRVGRQLNFRVVLRDNRASGGGVNDDHVTLTVDGASGPFQVTAPNTAVNWTAGGQQTVTWNVNNTNAAPINAANVKISLSVDGGQSFPFVLAASTPNDGTENITVPNGIISALSRIKVEAVGNIFFDISDVNFLINAGATCPYITSFTPGAGNAASNITLTGTGFTGVTSVRFSNNLTATFNVVNDTTITTTVPAGAVSGPLTLSKANCPDVQSPAFVVCPNPPVTLQIDDGGIEAATGGTYFANRLTPANYPATLRSVFLQLDNTIPAGTNIKLLVGMNEAGGTNINNVVLQQVNVVTGAPGQMTEYNVPSLTITAGDFIVGCMVSVQGVQFPMPFDNTAPQMRSYFSFDGTSWTQRNDRNFPIRAGIYAACGGVTVCPAVTGLASNSGTIGSSVTINGTNFTGVTGVRFSNNVNATFTVNGASQIIATVPNGAVTGPITISRPNCADVQTAAFTINPITCATVTGVNPTRVAGGGTVTITGTGLTGVAVVKFVNEVSATFTVDSDTQITATVPLGAAPGPITLSKIGCPSVQTAQVTLCNTPLVGQIEDGTRGGGANGAFGQVFLVNRITPVGYPATVNSVALMMATFQQIPTGANITILAAANPNGGTNINNVNFQQVNTQVGALNQFTSYNLTTPITINAGDFLVGFSVNLPNTFPQLNNNVAPQGRSYTSNNGTTFTVLPDANLLIRAGYTLGCGAGPTCAAVTNLNPTTAAIGAQVTITGTGLTGVTGVKFSNNVTAQFVVNNDTQITATVPAGAVTGPLTISKPACADLQTAAFTINTPANCPAITNMTPAEGLPGTLVTLTGTGFTGVTSVQFPRSIAAPFTVISDTQLTFTVPEGVQTGPVTLSKPSCTATQTVDFTVLPTPDPMLAIGDGGVVEPDGPPAGKQRSTTVNFDDTVMTFTVRLSGVKGYNNNIFVNYSTANGTAVSPDDYQATSGTLTFAPPFLTDTVMRTVSVVIEGDDSFEPNEDFFITLSNNINATLGDAQGHGMIFNEDCPALALSLTNQNLSAAGTNASVNITGGVCGWQAQTDVPWITFTGNDEGDGDGALNYQVAANSGPSRIGTIYVNDATLVVFQATSDITQDSDLDGIPDSVEITENRNPQVKDNDIFTNNPTSNRLFVMQQYRDFLGREGDSGGITNWVNALNANVLTRAQVVESFFNSAEFQNSGAPIVRLYFAYFLRIPDYAGLQNWINAYRAGMPLDTISNQFAGSAEFIQTYGNLDNTAFVTLVYNNVLGRAPDPVGLANWVNALNNGMTRGTMMLGFSESQEYKNRSGNWVYVTMMYVGMLRRAPEQAGFDNWVNYLIAGNSGLNLINGFIGAPEYHNRFLP